MRFISLEAGTLPTGEPPSMLALGEAGSGPASGRLPVAYEERYLWEIYDVLCLMSALSQAVSYTGSWHINVRVDKLAGYISNNSFRSLVPTVRLPQAAMYDADVYSESMRATYADIMNSPRDVTASLLRLLFRGLGNERYLDQWVAIEG